MTLKQMRYAMAVASFGSINDAARRLYITQPALTNSSARYELSSSGWMPFPTVFAHPEKSAKPYLSAPSTITSHLMHS